MKPALFSYAAPRSLDEALVLLAEHADDAQILAGGQSLAPMLNLRLAAPDWLIDVNRVPGLDVIEETAEGLRVGAMTRQNALLDHVADAPDWSLLAQAIPHVAHRGIRNRGTIGGSVALADPAAEAPACAIALDAVIRLASVRGEREVPASDFFLGLYETAREPDEMIVAVFYPRPAPGWLFGFDEVARRRGDYALAGLCAGMRVEEAFVRDARLVFFAVGDRPTRARVAEDALIGRNVADIAARAAACAAARAGIEVMPGGDCGVEYKRRLVGVLLERQLARFEAMGGDRDG
ncbi:MAG: xanthine dehydrogenase family protein subunit M [Salinarimonadaceae bacterium]|nr:MAG: xanthine dehydrogenase family protein subunit M [Salinarimonadaceae bacterium]